MSSFLFSHLFPFFFFALSLSLLKSFSSYLFLSLSVSWFLISSIILFFLPVAYLLFLSFSVFLPFPDPLCFSFSYIFCCASHFVSFHRSFFQSRLFLVLFWSGLPLLFIVCIHLLVFSFPIFLQSWGWGLAGVVTILGCSSYQGVSTLPEDAPQAGGPDLTWPDKTWPNTPHRTWPKPSVWTLPSLTSLDALVLTRSDPLKQLVFLWPDLARHLDRTSLNLNR